MGSKKLLALSASVILLTASDSSAVITEIIDSTGDGLGNTLNAAVGVVVDSHGNVYVTGKLPGERWPHLDTRDRYSRLSL